MSFMQWRILFGAQPDKTPFPCPTHPISKASLSRSEVRPGIGHGPREACEEKLLFRPFAKVNVRGQRRQAVRSSVLLAVLCLRRNRHRPCPPGSLRVPHEPRIRGLRVSSAWPLSGRAGHWLYRSALRSMNRPSRRSPSRLGTGHVYRVRNRGCLAFDTDPDADFHTPTQDRIFTPALKR
jgi:hypothetical protein